jgi:transposase
MPSRFPFRAVMAVIVRLFSLVFPGNVVTRRRACKDPASLSGRIIITVTGMRRRHGQCQVAGDLAASQRCGQASGQFSRDLANPQVGAAGTSAAGVVVAPAAQELATWVETNRARPVSGQVANAQVSSVNSGQTKGDLTARQQGGPDPKEAALAGARCLNPHPEQVTDPEFLASEFFDARDAVQVKYEMVRKVQVGGVPVTEAAAAFGYSRPAYYAAAAALESAGLEGLVPARPGPRGGHKLTGQILAWAEQQLAADPALRPAQLAGPIEESFGVRVHPRSIEKALARRRERHSKR